jgi:hypothetical protein
MNENQFAASKYKADIQQMTQKMNAMRRKDGNPVDISLADMVKHKHGVSLEAYMEDLGIQPNIDTIQNLVNLPDPSVRFLIPEIFRESLRLGLRTSPIYPNIIAAEISVKQPTMIMPWFNMSEATPSRVGTAETIPQGNVSFASKSVTIGKMGKAIAIPYEVMQYVSVNLVSIFLQDFGIKLGMGIDSMAIDCLINGEQADGSESAAVIGVASASTLTYKDILKVWLRMARIGRTPDSIIGGEDAALLTMDLAEFKNSPNTAAPFKTLDLKTPLPQRSNYFIHGNVPSNSQLIIDSGASLIKLNAQPLLLENDREISNQTLLYTASLTTGFTTLYRDGRVRLNHSLAFSGANVFPAWMNPDAQQNTVIK